MKTISMEYDEYLDDIKDAHNKGSKAAVKQLLSLVRAANSWQDLDDHFIRLIESYDSNTINDVINALRLNSQFDKWSTKELTNENEIPF